MNENDQNLQPDTRTSEEHALRRGLTGPQVAMIGLSGALGTGLFLGSGEMIKIAGPSVILSYALTGLLSLVVVWALAEMTVVHPVAGGFGATAHAYLGPIGGWFMRWNVAVVMCIAVGVEVVATGKYLHWFWPGLSVEVGTVLSSLVIIAINMATVKAYGHSEYWFSIIKVAMVVAFIALGTILIFFGLPSTPAIGTHNFTGGHGWQGFAPFGIKGMLVGAVMAIFSFGGVENVSVASAESENPERDVPRAARAMILRLVFFYVGAIAVVIALQPWQHSATTKESPFVTVLSLVNIPAAAGIMNFILITAALSAANGCLYASARMLHSLALDHLAPAAVARTSAHGAPRNAVALATLGMLVASVITIVSPDNAFKILYGILIFGLLTTWVLIVITYLGFRRGRAQLGLPGASARLWGGPATAVLTLVVFAAIYVAIWFIEGLSFAMPIGVGYVAVLTAAYFLVRTRVKKFGPSVLDDELVARADAGVLPDNALARERAQHALVRIGRAHGMVAAGNDGEVPAPPHL
ncbi:MULTISPECIES: amino acid permease [unclassified Luteococcus]|uniref:amino acid permease n=1 Tax=unclassified Luteococcus TaxID=2639923 RepID=UPI00313AF229